MMSCVTSAENIGDRAATAAVAKTPARIRVESERLRARKEPCIRSGPVHRHIGKKQRDRLFRMKICAG